MKALTTANNALAAKMQKYAKRMALLKTVNSKLAAESKKKDKKELAVRNLNRLYNFTSQVNQNIVQVKDEDALFKNACEIAGKFGEFKIAWIGLFDRGKSTVSLKEQIGIAPEDLHYFFGIPLKPNGPQEHIIRSGGNYICNDILNEDQLKSWKPQAIKQAVNSCMILPIRKSGEIIGTFNLYAGETGFFQKAEIALLLQVSDNISFALDNFDAAKKQLEAEELVVISEKRFRLLIEKSADMITLATRDGRLIYASPYVTTALGYSTDDLRNMPLYDIVHPDDIPELLEKRNDLLKNPGKSFSFRHRRRHKNGEWIWCEGTFTNMLDEPGIHAVVSNFRDISEKKKIEQQREFEENNLNALINNTNALMWSVDRNFHLITSNEPFDHFLKEMLGYKISKGHSILPDVFPPEKLLAFKGLYERAFAGETFTEIEYTSQPLEVWSEISYSPIRKGDEVVGAACHSRDITKTMLATQQVIINERRYRALVENGADSVVILTTEGKPTYISPTFEKVLGYTEAEAMQLDWFSVFHPDDIVSAVKSWEQMLVSPGIPVPVNASRIIHKDSNWRWLEGTLTNLLHDAAVNGIVNNFRDVTEKKLVEESLLLTQYSLEHAGDAVFWMTDDARIIKVNEAACIMLGYSKDELVGLSVPDIDPYYDAEYWKVHYAELRQKGSLFFETVQRAKDGRLIPVEIRANCIKFGNAELNCAFCRDISERKDAENSLVKSEIFNRGVLNSLSSHISVIDNEGNIVAANEAWDTFSTSNGEPNLQLTGKGSNYFNVCETSAELGEEAAIEALRGIKDILNEKRTSFYLEYPCHSPDEERWFGMRARKFESEKPMVVISHENISERKLAEKSLLKSKSRLIEAQGLAHIGNFEVNLQDLSEIWSAEIYKMLGMDKGQVSTKEAFSSFIHPDDLCNLENALDAKKDTEIDYRFIRKDGAERFAHGILKFELDDNQIAKRLYGTMQDITERKLTEAERTKIVNDLVRRNTDLEQFAYIVSHNLRAPIANIIGAAGELNDADLTPEDRAFLGNGIANAVNRLDEVVNDLNSVLEIKNDVYKVREAVKFPVLVDHITKGLQNLIDKNEIEIKYDFSETDEFFTLKAYLYSIFYNLISNSIKYRQPLGKCRIEIKSHIVKHKLELTFKDNGMGINLKKNGGKIFGLYNRFHTHAEGRGMGLFMVKTQVEALGGKISLKSRENEGTEVKIEFEL